MANKAQRFGARNAPAKKSSPAPGPKLVTKSDGMDDYRARDDAETIARAAAIKADPQRRTAAAREASKMADERSAQARALRGFSKSGGR